MKESSADRCPCGGAAGYRECCGRYHDGEAAPTAVALMRSRYAAYVLGLRRYLVETWHPSTRPDGPDLEDSPSTWLGLSVKRNECADDDHATVEFVARYKVNGRACRLHEISRFVREGGRWFYVEGRFPES